jgi:arsenite methyltransferase
VTEQLHTELPQALQRALDLLAEPPADPDVSKGYLDLLKESIESPTKNTGARAVRAEAGPRVGFLRADAQQLPLRDETVDAVTSVAMLQLIPNPGVALAEMARVLRPGGRIAVMVPTAGSAGPLWGILPDGGARFFGEDELGDIFEDLGLVGVRTRSLANFQWVRAKRP